MRLLIGATTMALALAGAANAVTYSAYDSFQVTATGVAPSNFTFGYAAAASPETLAALTFFQPVCGPVLQCATVLGVDALGFYKAPGDYDAPGTPFFNAGLLNAHPGPSGQLAAVQFAAPTAGEYAFTSIFKVHDVSPTGVDIFIYRGGLQQFSGVLNGGTPSLWSDFNATLAAGETVTFLVGPRGFYGFDSTGLEVTASIAAVPEPAAWATMIGGFGLAGFSLRRRRQVATA